VAAGIGGDGLRRAVGRVEKAKQNLVSGYSRSEANAREQEYPRRDRSHTKPTFRTRIESVYRFSFANRHTPSGRPEPQPYDQVSLPSSRRLTVDCAGFKVRQAARWTVRGANSIPALPCCQANGEFAYFRVSLTLSRNICYPR
jgi:hypothetical protein